jgi:hypothetical protein
MPWQKCPQRTASGSAFVLDTQRRLLITNSHVVRARHDSKSLCCALGM